MGLVIFLIVINVIMGCIALVVPVRIELVIDEKIRERQVKILKPMLGKGDIVAVNISMYDRECVYGVIQSIDDDRIFMLGESGRSKSYPISQITKVYGTDVDVERFKQKVRDNIEKDLNNL